MVYGEEHDELAHFMLFNISYRLFTLGYFEDDFEPIKCCCGCNKFVDQDIDLACTCARYHEYFDFLVDKSEDTLETYMHVLMNYKEKILALLKDTIKFYEECGYDICDNKFELQWNQELNRFVIIYSNDEISYKESLRKLYKERLIEVHHLNQRHY